MGFLFNRFGQVMPLQIETLFEAPVTTPPSTAARASLKALVTPTDSPLMARFCQQIGSPSSASGWEMPLIDNYLLDGPHAASTATSPESDVADISLHLCGGGDRIIYETDRAGSNNSPHYSSSYFPSASGAGSACSIHDAPLFQLPSIPSLSLPPNDSYPIPHLNHHRSYDLELKLSSPLNHGAYNTAFRRAHFGTFPVFAPFPTFSFSHLLTDHEGEEPQLRLAFVFGIGEEAEFTFRFPYVEEVLEEAMMSEEVSPVRSPAEVSEHMPLNPLKSSPVPASQPRFRLQQSRLVTPSINARRGAKPLQPVRTDRK